MTAWLLEARVCTYDTPVSGSRLAPGCFSRSLAERYPPLRWHHDGAHGIGVAVAHRDTPDALELTFRIDGDAPMARRVVELVEAGQLTEFSVGFGYRHSARVRGRITFANLDETSIVYRGACSGTRVLSLVPVVDPARALTDEEREADEVLAMVDRRVGAGRSFDPVEYWVGESERRARVG